MGPDAVFDLGLQANHPEAEAIVLSCTDMRSVEVIARLETALGKPVITSNQAMVREALDVLTMPDKLLGYGQLLERR